MPHRTISVSLTVLPLVSDRMSGRFDIFAELSRSLERNGAELRNGDVLVVSTKYASNSEERILDMAGVRVSASGMRLSRRFALDPKVAEVILRESGEILGGMAGFVLATSAPFAPVPGEPLQSSWPGQQRLRRPQGPPSSPPLPAAAAALLHGVMAPNAGVDTSNIGRGRAILYPDSPYGTAEALRRKIFLNLGVMAGVILADSRLMPARVGTIGVAVAYAGLDPVLDSRSKPDLDGNPLKVTFQATADAIATIANHAMGEGAESRPFVIVRDSGAVLTGRRASPSDVVVPAGQCVYVRGLSAHAGSDAASTA